MSPELDDKLCAKYPKIFSERHGDPKETLMCWGFECGDGWYNILNALCQNIQSYIEFNNRRRTSLLHDNQHNLFVPELVPQVIATQVKEKFGTLSFYYEGGDQKIDGMVRMAESMSAVTCEVCGSPGKLTGRSWYRTLCEQHTKEYGK